MTKLGVAAAVAVFVVLLASAVPAWAGCPGTINFDNSAGTGLWMTPDNWDANVLPAAGDDVCINGFGVTLNAGTSTVNSVMVTGAGGLTIGGTGFLTLAAASVFDGPLILAGNLAGAADMAVNGSMSWTGGRMSGSGRTVAAGGIQIAGPGGTLGRRLEVPSTSTVTMAANLSCEGVTNPAVVDNAGLWDVQNDADFVLANFPCTFSNTGTFRKSAGTGLSSTSWTAFNNTGAVEIQSGTFTLTSGTHTGSFAIAAGATLGVTLSVTNNFNAGSTVSGPGQLSVSSGTVNFNAGYAGGLSAPLSMTNGVVNFNTGSGFPLARLTQSGGTLQGADTVTVSGPTSWTGGAMAGSGRTVVAGGMQLPGTASLSLKRDIEVPAAATVTMAAGIVCEGVTNPLVVDNAGLWDLTNDADFLLANAPCTFNNTGTFRKSAGTGLSSITWSAFNNAGQVEALAGTLSVPAYTQTAGSTTLNGGALSSASAMHIQGGVVRGQGTITAPSLASTGEVSPGLSPGTLALSGTYAQGPAGRLPVELRGPVPGTEHDQVNIGGAASLGGDLTVDTTGFTPAAGQTFTVLTFASRTGVFNSLTQIPPTTCGQEFSIVYNPTSVVLQLAPGVCPDVDNDGFAACCAGCTPAAGDVCGDCADGDPAIKPGAIERCDSVDNNCAGGIDEGFALGLSCDGPDGDLCNEGVTVCNAAGTGTACNDTTPTNGEICDMLDNDCDGKVDEDLFAVAEACNDQDDNCNGLVDEGNPGGGAACTTGGLGVCDEGTMLCRQGALSCFADRGPGPELCDALDNDCDGETDETKDSDGDGAADCTDTCPDAFNPPADCDGDPGTPDEVCDADADGLGDICDCSPLDPVNPSPAEVALLQVSHASGATSIGWDPAPGPGRYNLYRGYMNSGVPRTYDHQCLRAALPLTTAQDPLEPRGLTAFYYLVSSVCAGVSESIAGRDSTGTSVPVPYPCADAILDADGDGTEEAIDTCPGFMNPSQSDADGDAHGDVCDNCPVAYNPGQEDFDLDGLGDACDGT